MLKLYDKIRLVTGETAWIVEVLESGVAYMVDVDKEKGGWETITVSFSDIKSVFRERGLKI